MRRLQAILLQDLTKKMVLLAGPRQCGKTTLALATAKALGWPYHYYSWDIDKDRRRILHGELEAPSRLWILDELHKYRHWKNWLKGQYDQHHFQHHFLVTGSARLDAYSRGGDSLQGRYYFHRLHPFTLSEYLGLSVPRNAEEMFSCANEVSASARKALEELVFLGGFPEPLFSGSGTEANRWRLAYGTRLVREEIRTLERLQDLDKVELLLDHLPVTVGSVLSINSLREDLEVAFETARHWIAVLERLYACFRVAPYGPSRVKAVKKEQKLYFWDWGRVENEAARFENLVALHLLRLIHWFADVLGEKWELRYFRDTAGREVDFILLRKGKPWYAVEAKLDERPLDGNLKYLLERAPFRKAFQISLRGHKDWEPEPINGCRVRILPAFKLLGNFV